MAKRIVTKNKKDIVTGFDIEADFDFFQILSGVFQGHSFPQETIHDLARQSVQQCKPQMDSLIDQAEEIFIEEASLSRWSGNMIDNSVCGISGTMPTSNGENLKVDVRVGVNHKEIMNIANWSSRANRRPGRANASPVIYEYNGFRMRPGVDYSIMLDDGTARIPNSTAWAGFVLRAEERFNAL